MHENECLLLQFKKLLMFAYPNVLQYVHIKNNNQPHDPLNEVVDVVTFWLILVD